MSEKVYVQVGVKGRSIPVGGEAGQILQKNSDNDFDCVWTTPAGGTSANIPQPATTTPLSDASGGAVGTGVSFARSDHQHQLNVSSTVTDVKMNGTAALGSLATYARTDHIHATDTSRASQTDMTTAQGNITALQSGKENKKLVFTSVEVETSDWESDLTYTDFPYKATISATDVTSGMIPEVIFDAPDAVSGNFAPVAESGTDEIFIWAAEAIDVTIPTIIVWGANT